MARAIYFALLFAFSAQINAATPVNLPGGPPWLHGVGLITSADAHNI